MNKAKLKSFIKSAANIKRKAEIAKKFGLLLEGDWRWAAKKLRPMGTEYTKEVPKSINTVGAVSGDLLGKIIELSKRVQGKGVEVGADVSKTKLLGPYIGSLGRSGFDQEAIKDIKYTIHTHPMKGMIELYNSLGPEKFLEEALFQAAGQTGENIPREVIKETIATMKTSPVEQKTIMEKITNFFKSFLGDKKLQGEDMTLFEKFVRDTENNIKTVSSKEIYSVSPTIPGGNKIENDLNFFREYAPKANHTILNPDTGLEGVHKILPEKYGKPYRSIYFRR